MNRQVLDQETRKYLRAEAEWLLDQEIKAVDQIEMVIIRLGYGQQAPRYIQSPSTEHSVILTKRVVVYDPYTGGKRFGARLLGLSVLPIRTLAWVIDSMVYGFTKNAEFGHCTPPNILWDLVRYPGARYSRRQARIEGGDRYDRKY